MRWWRLEKCVQSCGGRRTEPGYTNSTCRLANRWDGGAWKMCIPLTNTG
jgi:hypothetical protein